MTDDRMGEFDSESNRSGIMDNDELFCMMNDIDSYFNETNLPEKKIRKIRKILNKVKDQYTQFYLDINHLKGNAININTQEKVNYLSKSIGKLNEMSSEMNDMAIEAWDIVKDGILEITEYDRNFLNDHFVSNSGKVKRTIKYIIKDYEKNTSLSTYMEYLKRKNALTIGIYDENIKLELTEIGLNEISSSTTRFYRMIKKFLLTIKKHAIGIISGVTLAIIAANVQDFFENIISLFKQVF